MRRRFKIFYIKPPPEVIPAVGHTFAMHVQSVGWPIVRSGALPGDPNRFNADFLRLVEAAPGPLTIRITKTRGLYSIELPAYCSATEAMRIVESAMLDVFERWDGEPQSPEQSYARLAHELRKRLREASEAEDYERAAEIRRELRNLQDGHPGDNQ